MSKPSERGVVRLTGYPPAVRLFQAGGLVRHTRILRDLVRADPAHVSSLVTATFLMAAAAAEAILSEYAHSHREALYADRDFRKGGAVLKFKLIFNESFVELEWLWAVRVAIGHSEPDNVRSTQFGIDITAEGADRAYKLLCDLAVRVWGDAVPASFTKVTGIPGSA